MEPLEPRPSPPEPEVEVEIVGDRVPVANVAPADLTLPTIPLKWWQETRGMPRRFGVGSLMAVTVTYAVVFSVATALGAHPVVTAGLFVLLMAVTAGQVFLFGGKRPRLASVVAGAVLVALGGVLTIIARMIWGGAGLPSLLEFGFLIVAVSFQCALGALLGYLAGAIVGGTFVVIEMFRRIVRRARP